MSDRDTGCGNSSELRVESVGTGEAYEPSVGLASPLDYAIKTVRKASPAADKAKDDDISVWQMAIQENLDIVFGT
jgi:hypothetical protein